MPLLPPQSKEKGSSNQCEKSQRVEGALVDSRKSAVYRELELKTDLSLRLLSPQSESNVSDVSSTSESCLPRMTYRSSIDEERFLVAKQRTFKLFNNDDERKWTEDYFFICLADTQLGMWNQIQEEEMAKISVTLVNQLQPKFVIVCGDLINTYADRDLKKRNLEIRRFKEIFSRIDKHIPLVCVCGNHDVGNRPNPFTLNQYTNHFGDDYFSFWCGGVKYLVLNSQIIKDSSDCTRETKIQELWLDEELSTCEVNSVHNIAFMHIPPFVNVPDEHGGFFNIGLKPRIELLEKLVKGQYSKLFCGHYHRNAGGTYKDLEVVVTGAVGSSILPSSLPGADPLEISGMGGFECTEDTSGMRIVGVRRDEVVHKWFTLERAKVDFASMNVTKEQVFKVLDETTAGCS